MRSPGVKGIYANALLCCALIHSVARGLGFFVEARYITEPIVEKEELQINSRFLLFWFFMFVLLISNHTVFLVQFEINLHW